MGIVQAPGTELHNLISTLEDEGHALAAKFRAVFNAIKAEVPQLVGDAETDAAEVVQAAETQGLDSAEQTAAADAGKLAAEAGADLASAVAAPAEADPAPAEPTA